MSDVVGYSGKPVWQKLGINEGSMLHVGNAPTNLDEILTGVPGWIDVSMREGQSADIGLLFEQDSAKLAHDFAEVQARIVQGGMIWICWPKKASGVTTDITEQTLRDIILPTGWVDTKVCAVSEVWSGLKFLRRKQ